MQLQYKPYIEMPDTNDMSGDTSFRKAQQRISPFPTYFWVYPRFFFFFCISSFEQHPFSLTLV